MKNLKIFSLIILLFCVIVFILTIMDFAALHDIRQDYVSQYILDYLEVTPSEELPDWTSTSGEWDLVAISLYLRFIFLIVNIAFLVYFYRKMASNINHTKQ